MVGIALSGAALTLVADRASLRVATSVTLVCWQGSPQPSARVRNSLALWRSGRGRPSSDYARNNYAATLMKAGRTLNHPRAPRGAAPQSRLRHGALQPGGLSRVRRRPRRGDPGASPAGRATAAGFRRPEPLRSHARPQRRSRRRPDGLRARRRSPTDDRTMLRISATCQRCGAYADAVETIRRLTSWSRRTVGIGGGSAERLRRGRSGRGHRSVRARHCRGRERTAALRPRHCALAGGPLERSGHARTAGAGSRDVIHNSSSNSAKRSAGCAGRAPRRSLGTSLV